MEKAISRGRIGAFSLLAVVLASCGGDEGDGGSVPGNEGRVATISGNVVKGPVSGARVCAYEISGTIKGKELACASTRADGSYDLAVEHRGPVIVEATGGIYVDEATGQPGVSLTTPLATLGEVTAGTTTLVATPLTTLAVNAAGRSGSLSTRTFEAAALQVKTAFGLGVDVDLARSRPNVSPATINAYGRALVGLSRMLQAGASLPQVVASADLAGLKAAYEHCSSAADPDVEVLSGLSSIPTPGGANALITVFVPNPAWRATLPTAGPLGQTGCTIEENNADRVRLSCDPTTRRSILTIRAGAAAANGTYESTASSSALTLAGARIVLSGGELLTDLNAVITIDTANGSVQMGMNCLLAETGGIVLPISGGGVIINNDNTLPTLVPGGSIVLSGGGSGSIGTTGVPPGSTAPVVLVPTISLPGLPVPTTIAANGGGAVREGGSISIGAGSVLAPSAAWPGNVGSVVINFPPTGETISSSSLVTTTGGVAPSVSVTLDSQ